MRSLGVLVLGECGVVEARRRAVAPAAVVLARQDPDDAAAPEKTLSGELTPSSSSPAATWRSGGSRSGSPTGSTRRSGRAAIVYRDALLSRPVEAERLRAIPSGSYRGYPLELIEPTCGGEETGATVTVLYGEAPSVDIPVEDETQVVGRWSEGRCAETRDRAGRPAGVVAGHPRRGLGSDAVALFRLTAHRPAGRGPSRSTPSGAPRCTRRPTATSGPSTSWSPGRTDEATIELPAQPARCDIHAFGSATGGTTFFVNVTIDGEPAQVRVAMSPEVTDEAFSYAAEVCGF